MRFYSLDLRERVAAAVDPLGPDWAETLNRVKLDPHQNPRDLAENADQGVDVLLYPRLLAILDAGHGGIRDADVFRKLAGADLLGGSQAKDK